MSTTIRCEDTTCVYNYNNVCQAKEIEMQISQDDHCKTVVICQSYKDGREKNA